MKISRVAFITLFFLISNSLICTESTQSFQICNFNHERDAQEILDLFEKNWHRLVEGDDKTLPPFMLKYRTYDTNPQNFGSLHFKIIRENNQLAGFAAYYLEKPTRGQILLLAVGENFRGKGYGTILMKEAIRDLFSFGADHITLWTDTDNYHAHRVYEKLGFKGKLNRQNGHILFTYWPQ